MYGDNITKRKNEDFYCVIKKVEGKIRTFGRFKSREEAEMWRDYFKRHDWNIGLIGVDKANGLIDKSKR